MTAKSETKITEDIIAWIKDQGGDAFHVHGSMYQRSGEPDISGEMLCPQKTIASPKFIHIKWEVKTPTGKPSKLQLYRLDKYSKMGYSVGIVTSIEECMALVDEFAEYGNNKQSWSKTHELYRTKTRTTR